MNSISIQARNLLSSLGFDRAVSISLILRVLQLCAGLVTVILIPKTLTASEQGFHFTFGSLMAMQIFFDLGLSSVIAQFASHELVKLNWNESGMLIGDTIAKERLASLFRMVVSWYGAAAVLMIAALLPLGLYFFSSSPDAKDVANWRLGLLLVVVGAAGNLLLGSLFSMLEGCNRVADIATCRTFMEVIAYTVFWTVLHFRGGILGTGAFQLARFAAGVCWALAHYRLFVFDMLKLAFKKIGLTGEQLRGITWREVWSMQWRISLSLLSGFFIFHLFNPVLLRYHGAKAAGQMGLSISMASALSNGGLVWVATKFPQFGMLISKRDFAGLNRLFFRALWQSWALLVTGCATCWGVFYTLGVLNYPISDRVLSPIPLGLLLGTMVVNHGITCQAIYLRAHKQEPFLVLTVVVGACIALSTYFLGSAYGALGLTAGYFCLSAGPGLLWATYIFIQKRKEWHAPLPSTEPLVGNS